MLGDLDWLPPPPADFRAQCRALSDGTTAQRLATHRLDGDELHRLGSAIARLADRTPLTPLHLGILADGTFDLLITPLLASAARHGLALTITLAPFGQALQTVLDPASPLHQADAVLVALDHRSLPFDLDGLLAKLLKPLPIVATVAPPPEAWLGSLERTLPNAIRAFNDRVAGPGRVLFDVAGLAATVGLARWHDPTQWLIGKWPFAQQLIPLYAEALARLLGAVRGRSRKCLVLDLDHTLWGGAIGDDGLSGIVVGNGDPIGEAFLAVQRAALELRARGVLLAVCSKNDDEQARLPFRQHPDMLLREEHFSAFVANWSDKAENLQTIAQQLHLGLDALVLLDDNPAERAQVRARLPEVAVPELPSDPALYPRRLAWAGYFESVALGDDDRLRAARYAEDAERYASRAGGSSGEEYLRSLEMRALMGPIDALSLARVTQLVNKTNQFNLTTQRYTEPQVAQLAARGFTAQARLIDRFGDSGIVAVILCVPDGSDWRIDSWLMSCRVLGRKLEQAMLQHLVVAARRAGARALVGEYRPTARNGIVRELYPSLGFAPVGNLWRLDVASFVVAPLPIEVVEKL